MNTGVSGKQWWLTQQSRWQALPGPARLYRLGLLLFGATLVLGLVSGPHDIVALTLMAGGGACGLALATEIYSWIARRAEKLAFKVTFAILSVMAIAIATGAAMSYVAVATGQEPTAFKTATAFLAPLAFFPILAFVLAVLALFGMPIALLLSIGKDAPNGATPHGDAMRLMGRLMGLVTLVAVLLTIPTASSGVDAKLKDLAAYSAYFLDMQPHASCGLADGDRVVRINDQIVVVGRLTDSGVAFVRRACPLAASTDELPPTRTTRIH